MTSGSRFEGIEQALRKEQAGALGVAGKQLQEALDAYDAHLKSGASPEGSQVRLLLDRIAEKVYALFLQREFIGFSRNNLEWLLATYDLPAGVMGKIGSHPGD